MHWHRLYFLIVSGFTAWVGYIGFFRPHEILRALVWPLPPLHARFVGALYLSATVFLLLSLAMRQRRQVEAIVHLALAWTGWLLLITVVHRNSFDPARAQTWFWVVAYISFPVAAAALTVRRTPALQPDRVPPLPGWAAACLIVQAIAYIGLGLALTIVPTAIATIWPWPITPLLAQVYSGPVLGWGVGCLTLARAGDRGACLVPAIGLGVFAALALLGSSWHLTVFTAGSVSKTVWFVTLSLILVAALALIAVAVARPHPMRLASAPGETA